MEVGTSGTGKLNIQTLQDSSTYSSEQSSSGFSVSVWENSSPQKIALHAIAGFIQASAAGQNGATGALAAMGNEAFTKVVASGLR